jgi:hypothetical protein
MRPRLNLCRIRRHGDGGGKLALRDTGCQDLVRRRQLSELNAHLGAPTTRLATMPCPDHGVELVRGLPHRRLCCTASSAGTASSPLSDKEFRFVRTVPDEWSTKARLPGRCADGPVYQSEKSQPCSDLRIPIGCYGAAQLTLICGWKQTAVQRRFTPSSLPLGPPASRPCGRRPPSLDRGRDVHTVQ